MSELLLINLGGTEYGIRRETFESLRQAENVFRPPLSSDFMAGLTLVDQRTVVLADLAACLGLPPASRRRPAFLLLLPSKKKDTGFLFEMDSPPSFQTAETFLPLPEYLQTPLVASCALLDQGPVPVIDLEYLHGMIRDAEWTPPAPPLSFPACGASEGPFRIVTFAGRRFAFPTGGLFTDVVTAPQRARIPAAPSFVAGVGFYRDRLVPLIDPALRLGLPAGLPSRMLAVELAGTFFGLLIDDDEGDPAETEAGALLPLPATVHVPAFAGALVRAGEILPLLHPPTLFTAEQPSVRPEAVLEETAPASGFPFRFGLEPGEVTEFALLGGRYALPRGEVHDVLPVKPWRTLPTTPPILLGVTELEGELWPVVDLAIYYGRRTSIGPDSRLVAVRKGEFKALVLAERTFGDRRLPSDIQRELPFLLPHRLVYGCYLDENGVLLVLNVQALTVHFTQELVRDFRELLAGEKDLGRETFPEAPAEPAGIPIPSTLFPAPETGEAFSATASAGQALEEESPPATPEAEAASWVLPTEEEEGEVESLPDEGLRSEPDFLSREESGEPEGIDVGPSQVEGIMAENNPSEDEAGPGDSLPTEEIGSEEIGSEEIGSEEIGSEEIGSEEIGSEEIGSEEIGSEEIGSEEIGSEEIGSEDAAGSREEPERMQPGEDDTVGAGEIAVPETLSAPVPPIAPEKEISSTVEPDSTEPREELPIFSEEKTDEPEPSASPESSIPEREPAAAVTPPAETDEEETDEEETDEEETDEEPSPEKVVLIAESPAPMPAEEPDQASLPSEVADFPFQPRNDRQDKLPELAAGDASTPLSRGLDGEEPEEAPAGHFPQPSSRTTSTWKRVGLAVSALVALLLLAVILPRMIGERSGSSSLTRSSTPTETAGKVDEGGEEGQGQPGEIEQRPSGGEQAVVSGSSERIEAGRPRSPSSPVENTGEVTGSGDQEKTVETEKEASFPAETLEYQVRPGDTLWDISAEKTGNPYNFKRLARENEIADPDLIYPEQKIRIKR